MSPQHLKKTLDVRLLAASDPGQASLAKLLMQLCQDAIGVGIELESFRSLPPVAKILQLSAGILGRLGYQDAADSVIEQARQLT